MIRVHDGLTKALDVLSKLSVACIAVLGVGEPLA